MILSLKVKNYCGIKEEAFINTIASNKIKRDNSELSSLDDVNKILKVVGIIGASASGKTSFISSIGDLKNFLFFPRRKKLNQDEEFIEYLSSLNKNNIKEFLKDFNTLSLDDQHIDKFDEPTEIELELYIPKRENNVPGIYNYKIIYGNEHEKNGVFLEELKYKEKYNSNKYKVLSSKSNIIESNISTAILYYNNDFVRMDIKYIDFYNTFYNEMIENVNLFFDTGDCDIKERFRKNKKLFVNFCNLVDSKIVDVSLADDQNGVKLLFWNKNKRSLTFSQLSSGTCKTIVLGCIIWNALENDDVIIIDEIENNLNHKLVKFLVELVSIKGSDNYSQLIFTTHSLTSASLLKNDQLYFIHNDCDDFYISNITDAIKKGIISKDQNVLKAFSDEILLSFYNNDVTNVIYEDLM